MSDIKKKRHWYGYLISRKCTFHIRDFSDTCGQTPRQNEADGLYCSTSVFAGVRSAGWNTSRGDKVKYASWSTDFSLCHADVLMCASVGCDI